MKMSRFVVAVCASVVLAGALAMSGRAGSGAAGVAPPADSAASWRTDPVWHDGLVEKATYAASKVIYGQPRSYTAIVFTNKEQHDTKTWTKATGSKSTVEVFKHNQIEAVPTPNYAYHFVTTSHLSVEGMLLTRYDQSSQEFCGMSFRSLLPTSEKAGREYSLETFSYMPEAGRVSAQLKSAGRPMVPEDALPLYLRDFAFNAEASQAINLLPTQKSNRAAAIATVAAKVRYAGMDGGDHKVELLVGDQLRGTYFFAADRQHVMTRYRSADGSQTYDLQTHERTDYWTTR